MYSGFKIPAHKPEVLRFQNLGRIPKLIDLCPEDAILLALPPVLKSVGAYVKFSFGKARCLECKDYYITRNMQKKLRVSFCTHFYPSDLKWTYYCPSCRRKVKADQGARIGLMNRGLTIDHRFSWQKQP